LNFCTVYHNQFTVYHHDLSAERIEWFWGALSAIRREIFEKLSGFSEAYPGASAEDLELGYRLSEAGREIRYFPELRGVHGRRFGPASMLYNDYHKSVLGLKLYLKRKPAGKHPHGFSRPKNGLNLALAPLTTLSLLAAPFTFGVPWLLFSIIFLAINFPFHRYLLKNAGFRYLLPSVFLHWLSFNVIALGVAGGLLGLALGRGLESKSRWL
jgi:cellulose synthase/poly-beta-1,6-N-acetylglucosamine synthase-like glycosyltransferase